MKTKINKLKVRLISALVILAVMLSFNACADYLKVDHLLSDQRFAGCI